MYYKLLLKLFPNRHPNRLAVHVRYSNYVDYTFTYKNKAESGSLHAADGNLIVRSLQNGTLKHAYRITDSLGWVIVFTIHQPIKFCGGGHLVTGSQFINLMKEADSVKSK